MNRVSTNTNKKHGIPDLCFGDSFYFCRDETIDQGSLS